MSRKKAKTLFAERISRLRKDAHLKQNEFAKRIGITQAYVSELELGKKEPSEQLLLSISRTFHVKMDWLKTGKGEIYGTTYTYSSDNPVVQAIIRQLLATHPHFALSEIAFLFGIDWKNPDKRLDLPEEYWTLIQWISKLFREKDDRRIKALLATMEVLKPSEEEMVKKIQEEFKKESLKK